jgi:hypothetical protein
MVSKYKTNSNPPITENHKSGFNIGENIKYKVFCLIEPLSISFLEATKRQSRSKRLIYVQFLKII